MNTTVAAWGKLLRISLSATAVGDILAGCVLATGDVSDVSAVLRLVAASLCIYHGGMALNDWADRGEDAEFGRERPIPEGQIGAGAALTVAALLLIAGPLLAASVDPAAATWALALTALVVLYDLVGRGDLLGPALLAGCRFLNLSLPFLALGDGLATPLVVWSAPLVYGVYVFTLSRLGRYEDGQARPLPGETPARLLLALAVLLLLVPLSPAAPFSLLGRAVAAGLCGWAAIGLVQESRRLRRWSAEQVPRAMGFALRRMLIFAAAFSALPGSPQSLLVAGLVLGLYPVSWQLRKVFPPS